MIDKAVGGILTVLLLFYESFGGKQNDRNEEIRSTYLMDSLWNLLLSSHIHTVSQQRSNDSL